VNHPVVVLQSNSESTQPMAVADIIEEQDAMKAHCYEFVLWPAAWQECHCSCVQNWQLSRLVPGEKAHIPDQPGIYTLLIQPGIVAHPACSYLMYVGQTTSLRRRFGQYLNKERLKTGRPKVFRVLNKYSDYVWFCFTVVSKELLTEVEDALVVAYVPPCNDQLPAEIRAVRGAF